MYVYMYIQLYMMQGQDDDGMERLNLTHCLWHALHPGCAPVLFVSLVSDILSQRLVLSVILPVPLKVTHSQSPQEADGPLA